MIPACAALVDAAHHASVRVIFVRHVLRDDYLDGGPIFNQLKRPIREAGAIARDSWEAELVDELRPLPQDFLVEKRRFSAFYGTDLEVILSSLEVQSLVVCGVTTNICVESTARDAALAQLPDVRRRRCGRRDRSRQARARAVYACVRVLPRRRPR